MLEFRHLVWTNDRSGFWFLNLILLGECFVPLFLCFCFLSGLLTIVAYGLSELGVRAQQWKGWGVEGRMGENQECEGNPWAGWPSGVLVTCGRGGCLWWSLRQGHNDKKEWVIEDRVEGRHWQTGEGLLLEVLVTDVVSIFWGWYLDSFFFQSQDECFKFDQCRAPWLTRKTFLFTNKPKKVDRDYWTQYLNYRWFIPESYMIWRVITISIIILSSCSSMTPMDRLTLLWN